MSRTPVRARPVAGLIVLAGLLLLVLRRPAGIAAPTIWAEDGEQFWSSALEPGLDLAEVYAGQWWMLQRLSLVLLGGLPPVVMPAALYLAACTIAALSVGVILQRRAVELFGALPYRVLGFAVLLLLPAAWEVQGNLTNIHVWLAAGLLMVLVLRAPLSALGKGCELAFVVISGLTGFLGVLLAPVALWGGVMNRSRYVWWRSGLLLAMAMVNVAVWSGSSRTPGQGLAERLAAAPEGIVKRWGGGSVLGQFPMVDTWTRPSRTLALLASAFVLLVLFLVWRDRRGPSPAWIATGLLWALLGIVSPAGGFGVMWIYDPTTSWRYFDVLIMAGFLVIVRSLGIGSARPVAVVALLACLPAMLMGWSLPPMGPAIPSADVQSFEACLDSTSRPCLMPIAPQGWHVRVEN